MRSHSIKVHGFSINVLRDKSASQRDPAPIRIFRTPALAIDPKHPRLKSLFSLGFCPGKVLFINTINPLVAGAHAELEKISCILRRTGSCERLDRKSSSLHRVESDPYTTLPTGSNGCIDECDASDAIIYSGK